MKNISSIIIGTLIILLFNYCTNSSEKENNTKEKIIENNELNFSIQFPLSDVHENTEIDENLGSMEFNTYTCYYSNDSNFYFKLRVGEFPDTLIHSDSINIIYKFFDFIHNQKMKSLSGFKNYKLVFIDINKYPGISYKNYCDTYISLDRYYLVENVLYHLIITYKYKNDHDQVFTTFFDSFRILNKEVNPHPIDLPLAPVKDYELDFGCTETILDSAKSYSPVFGIVTTLLEKPAGEKRNDRLITVSQYPEESFYSDSAWFIDSIFTAKKEQFANVSQGEIIHYEKISVFGFPGIDLVCSYFDKDVMQVRLLIVENKMYYITLKSLITEYSYENMIDYFESFRLTN